MKTTKTILMAFLAMFAFAFFATATAEAQINPPGVPGRSTLSGTVRDANTSSPLSGIYVSSTKFTPNNDGETSFTQTDENGHYYFTYQFGKPYSTHYFTITLSDAAQYTLRTPTQYFIGVYPGSNVTGLDFSIDPTGLSRSYSPISLFDYQNGFEFRTH